MTFVEAVEASERLRPHLCAGLQAIQSGSLNASKDVDCNGSINLEEAYPEQEDGVRRWDYVVGLGYKGNRTVVVWLEPHPATSGRNQTEVSEKFEWLIIAMRRDAKQLVEFPEHIFIWLASGSVSRHMLRASRLVEQRGVKVKSGKVSVSEIMGWPTYGFPRR